MKISGRQRKGISPIVATVLIIAATLIAFAAVLGYIFGVFGGAASTAKTAITSVSAVHTCFQTTPAGTCTMSLTNTGTVAATANSGTIQYGGSTYALTMAATSIPADSASHSITISANPTGIVAASAGQTYVLSVSMSDGSLLTYTGTFA